MYSVMRSMTLASKPGRFHPSTGQTKADILKDYDTTLLRTRVH